jgi:hypothetical protein
VNRGVAANVHRRRSSSEAVLRAGPAGASGAEAVAGGVADAAGISIAAGGAVAPAPHAAKARSEKRRGPLVFIIGRRAA